MKKYTYRTITVIGLGLSLGLTSCSDDDTDEQPIQNNGGNIVATPATYEFNRNGATSVSYSGQTERLDQLGEMKSYIQDAATNKTQISAQTLKDMFENTGGNGNGNFSFTSTKQLSDKTFDADRQSFNDMFDRAALASDSGIMNIAAKDGTAGILTRSNGNTVLLDANGHEFTQELEKGLMGATFYNQIVNNYLTEDKIGSAVNNTDLVSGKNYTAMEHHLDEAFGYFGAPIDFTRNYTGTGNPRYWASYSDEFDMVLPLIDELMNPFKTARQAIIEKKYGEMDVQVEKIYTQFEILIASASIHYINKSLSTSDDADRMHVLSEGYFFLKAFRYSNINNRKLSQAEVTQMIDVDFGNNFWQISATGLNNIKTKLSTTYNLDAVKDQL